MPGSDRCAAILAPRARQGGGAGRDVARRAASARTAFFCKGGARNRKKGWERSGGAGGDGRSGRAHGMGKRPSAGDGRTDDGGAGRGKRRKRKGERARADGAGRRGERARVEGGMQGPRKRSHDQGKAGVRGGGQREGSAGRCGRWMDARGRRTNGEERRPAGHKKRASALQSDPAGARKNSAPLLCKTTRRACAKKHAPALQNDLAGARKNSAPLLCKATRRARAKIARPCFTKAACRACAKKAHSCFTKRPGGRAQKSTPLLYKNGPARAKKARPCVKQGRAAGLRPPSPSGGSAARRASAC